jgi:hypothetical protein
MKNAVANRMRRAKVKRFLLIEISFPSEFLERKHQIENDVNKDKRV